MSSHRITRRVALQGLALGTAAYVFAPGTSAVAESLPGQTSRLPRAAPEAVGIDPAAIVAFIDAVNKNVGGLHSMMLVRYGKVAAEGWWAPYSAPEPHALWSLSKSFTSTAVGLAINAGLLTVDSQVISFFPNDTPAAVSSRLRDMKVRHLLTMSTGHDKDATGPTRAATDGNWTKAFLALALDHDPGSFFVYNSAATYMLSAIVQTVTGMTVLDYLKPRLFEPLGIHGESWEVSPQGINCGGWGLSVKTEDLAKFGQLYLQRGAWNGHQVIPSRWVDEATTKHISNGTGDSSDWTQGYCYQFWRCRHGAYRGDGAFGQYCVVMPQHNVVLAITSGVGDMQAVLNAVWDHLLPGIALGTGSPATSAQAFKLQLKRLTVPAPEGAATSATGARVSGKTYTIEPNAPGIKSVAVRFDEQRAELTITDAKGARRVECGNHAWIKGNSEFDSAAPIKAAARGAWTSPDTYTLKLCLYNTAYVQTVTLKFDGDKLTIGRRNNVSFGPTDLPDMVGTATMKELRTSA